MLGKNCAIFYFFSLYRGGRAIQKLHFEIQEKQREHTRYPKSFVFWTAAIVIYGGRGRVRRIILTRVSNILCNKIGTGKYQLEEGGEYCGLVPSAWGFGSCFVLVNVSGQFSLYNQNCLIFKLEHFINIKYSSTAWTFGKNSLLASN